jgi:hypothetical protein
MKRFFVAGKITLGAVLVLASTGAGLMAADDLPKAETILDRVVEVTGGKAAYDKVHSELIQGSMEINGMKGTMTTYKAVPDKSLTVVDLQGIGKIQNGSDGKVAWSNSAMQGPHVMEGEERDQALLQARFDSTVKWRDLFPKVETVGAETVEGKDCYKVMLTPKSGKPITQYFDKQTGLMVKMIMTVKSPMGEVTAESLADDYHKDGDILSPHKMTNKMMGMQFVMTVDKVEYNAEIPPSKFAIPDEIQALLNKDKDKK